MIVAIQEILLGWTNQRRDRPCENNEISEKCGKYLVGTPEVRSYLKDQAIDVRNVLKRMFDETE